MEWCTLMEIKSIKVSRGFIGNTWCRKYFPPQGLAKCLPTYQHSTGNSSTILPRPCRPFMHANHQAEVFAVQNHREQEVLTHHCSLVRNVLFKPLCTIKHSTSYTIGLEWEMPPYKSRQTVIASHAKFKWLGVAFFKPCICNRSRFVLSSSLLQTQSVTQSHRNNGWGKVECYSFTLPLQACWVGLLLRRSNPGYMFRLLAPGVALTALNSSSCDKVRDGNIPSAKTEAMKYS